MMRDHFNADRRHAAVMASLLKSVLWLMLPTLLHLLWAPQAQAQDARSYIALLLAGLQLFWGWRCCLDAYLFSQLASGETDEASLDQMLAFLFARQARPHITMMDRLRGARRLCWQFVLLTALYWAFQYAW